MRLGYLRERRIGPSLDVQRASMAAAGINVHQTHPPIYEDKLKPAKRTPPGETRLHLPERAIAIKHLRQRDEDELVVHDAATLGIDTDDIMAALAAIGRQGCTLLVWTPEPRAYAWHPDATEIVGLATEAAALIKSEKYRRASGKSAGSPPKLVGRVRDAALLAWADPTLTAEQAAARVKEVTGISVSARLLYSKLGHKSVAEATLAPPKLSAAAATTSPEVRKAATPKPKRKRRKAKARRKSDEC